MSNPDFSGHPGSGVIPCPFCQTPIPLSVERVLASQPLHCNGCDAVLTLNAEACADTLDALRRWHSESAAPAADTRPTGDEPVMIPRRRKPRRTRT